MSYFFGCDWGTTSFRLRLINTSDLQVLAEVANSDGCAKIHQQWLKEEKPESDRYGYYCNIISAYIGQIKKSVSIETEHIPLVISGMASSTVGMMNLPYTDVPFFSDGSDLLIQTVAETVIFPHPAIIISGVRTADDVMRGEETKLIGCLDDRNSDSTVIILPGTHPKHVYVAKNKITAFKTYMTGEFFDLLSKKSLLALSVSESGGFDLHAFDSGVNEAVKGGNLLHSSFLVRTNTLFERYSREQNFHYLSGLLIGTELKDLRIGPNPVLLADRRLGELYQQAFDILEIPLHRVEDADDALIKGQFKVLKNAGLLH